MGSWTKHFIDGTSYTGTDLDVAAGRASWRRSRLTGIKQVNLQHEGSVLSINGVGDYWQGDTLEAIFPEGESRLVKRRIMRRIEPSDLYFHYKILADGVWVSFDKKASWSAQLIPQGALGQWFVLELDVATKKVRRYFRSEAE